MASESARSAPSSGAASAAALSSRTLPSASRCSPRTDSVRAAQLTHRRREPALRDAEPEAAEYGAARGERVADVVTPSAFDHQPVSAGNAPHAAANQKSVWKRPPNSSRL